MRFRAAMTDFYKTLKLEMFVNLSSICFIYLFLVGLEVLVGKVVFDASWSY